MRFILLLFIMIFCHILDDFYLQGWLASAKQRSWWRNADYWKHFELYRNDYKMALFIHAFSWSFMMMLPLLVYSLVKGVSLNGIFIGFYMSNLIIHAYVDNLKANESKINLIQDQLVHLGQIIVTLCLYVKIYL